MRQANSRKDVQLGGTLTTYFVARSISSPLSLSSGVDTKVPFDVDASSTSLNLSDADLTTIEVPFAGIWVPQVSFAFTARTTYEITIRKNGVAYLRNNMIATSWTDVIGFQNSFTTSDYFEVYARSIGGAATLGACSFTLGYSSATS